MPIAMPDRDEHGARAPEKTPIPFYKSLGDIYPSSKAVMREQKRWNRLVQTFESRHGASPSYVVRAPGRVNVLGEHVDYSLFPVLPAALEEDILIALLPRLPSASEGGQINLSNVDPQYPPTSFRLARGSNGWDAGLSDPSTGGWGKYLRVALVECAEELLGREGPSRRAVGMDLVVSGTVPPGSGLSSSAAFVVASVLAFLVANGLEKVKTKEDVVRLAIASEHRMGLRTGGMDQSASVLCLPHNLIHLSFFPTLHPRPLPLPQELAIVITNSLAPHALASCAAEHYNLRVVEVLCAARVLLHRWGLSERVKKEGRGRVWLRQVLEWREEQRSHSADADATRRAGNGHAGKVDGGGERDMLERALAEIDVLKKEGGWTREEMVAASGLGVKEFEETYLHFLEIRADRFHLYERTLHTLTESLRVRRFVETCQALAFASASASTPNSGACGSTLKSQLANTNSHASGINCANGANGVNRPSHDTLQKDDGGHLQQLGELMNASHACMRDVYACTHPWVDELQRVCVQAGAIGSRMTGGGWGGSVVSLVHSDKVPGFLETVRKAYTHYGRLDDEAFGEAAFATLPGNGAGVYALQPQDGSAL